MLLLLPFVLDALCLAVSIRLSPVAGRQKGRPTLLRSRAGVVSGDEPAKPTTITARQQAVPHHGRTWPEPDLMRRNP